MSLRELIDRNRSYRRFDETYLIEESELRALVELARRSPSGANMQPLKYLLVSDQARCETVFPHLGWAGYLQDWPGPAPGERPTAYIVVLLDTEVAESAGIDHGIVAQSMLLGAVERGLGGCMIGSVNRPALQTALGIADRFKIKLVVALGKPAEEVVLETAEAGGIEYYRDDADRHHVPKRSLDDLIVQIR
jgi:nitroreductase